MDAYSSNQDRDFLARNSTPNISKKSKIFRWITIEPALLFYIISFSFTGIAFQTFMNRVNCQSLLSNDWSTYNFSRQLNQSEIVELCFNSHSNSPLSNLSSHLLIERSISARTSIWVFYVGVCQFLPACLSGAFLGAIGDLYSRKRVLLVALIGNALGALACAAVVHWFFNYYIFILVGMFL